MKTPFKSGMIAVVAAGVMASGTTLAPAVQAAEVNGPKLKWDVSLWGKKRAFTAGVERLSALVKEKTGGNWTIQLHYGGALSKSRENLDGISIDAFQAAMFCNFYHPKKNLSLIHI